MTDKKDGEERQPAPRKCSPERLRELLIQSLQDPNDKRPDLTACRWPAMRITACMAKHDRGTEHEDASRAVGREGTRHAHRLREMLRDEQLEQFELLSEIHSELRQQSLSEDDAEFLRLTLHQAEKQQEHLNHLAQAMIEVWKLFTGRLDAAASWRDIAGEAYLAFRDAMTPSNPERKYSIYNPGPAVRFVRLCLLEVTNQPQELGTISKALQRLDVTNWHSVVVP